MVRAGRQPGDDAAWIRREPSVSLILTDHDMPRLDGIALLRALAASAAAERRPAIPAILMSGDVSAGLKARALGAGARAVLWKPLEPTLLRATLADVVRRHGQAATADSGARSQESP